MKLKNKYICTSFAILLAFITFTQDYIASFINKAIGSKLSFSYLLFKDLMIIIFFILAIFVSFCKLKIEYKMSLIVMLLLISLAYCVSSSINNENYFTVIISYRSFLIPILALAVGLYYHKFFDIHIIMKSCTLIAIVSGVLDCVLLDSLWHGVSITNFYENVKHDPLINGLPANLYGDYGNGYFSTRRNVGLTGVPLTYAYLLLPVIAYWVNKICVYGFRINRVLILSVLFYLLIYTYTRAAILAALIVILMSIRNTKLKIMIASVIIFVPILFIDKLQTLLFDGSTALHIYSVITGFSEIKLWGSGVGAIGAYAQRYAGVALSLENSFLFILTQFGIVFFLIMVFICSWLFKGLVNNKDYPYRSLLMALLFTGLFSEQLFSPTSVVTSYLLIGIGIGIISYGAKMHNSEHNHMLINT